MSAPPRWTPGDRCEGICPTCGGRRPATFTTRSIELTYAGVEVPDLLVAVCEACGTTLGIPAQATPPIAAALADARSRKLGG